MSRKGGPDWKFDMLPQRWASVFFLLVFVQVPGLLPHASAAVTLVFQSGQSGWRTESVEKININGRPKVRLATTDRILPQQYKGLVERLLEQTCVRVHAAGYPLIWVSGAWQPAYPDGLAIKSQTTATAAWQSVKLQIIRQPRGKAEEIPVTGLVAILPATESGDALAEFVADVRNFTGVGETGPGQAFDHQMSLLVAVAPSAPPAAAARLKALLSSLMAGVAERAGTGIVALPELQTALRVAAIAELAFGQDPALRTLRGTIIGRKNWLDQRVAILKALASIRGWDFFLEKYGEFERFDHSFDDLRKTRTEAFRESAGEHREAGQRFYSSKQFPAAIREFRLASLRSPADRDLQALLDSARIEEARDTARRRQRPRPDPTSAAFRQLQQSLVFAENYIRDGKLEQAEGEILRMETLDPQGADGLLMRARLHQARKQLPQTLEILDDYDRKVIDPAEIAKGDALRANILYEIASTRDRLAKEIEVATARGDFAEASRLARSGAAIAPADPNLNYQAGVQALILRDHAGGTRYLRRYLELSKALPLEAPRRGTVYGVLSASVIGNAAAAVGARSWFSGQPLQDGVYYCPMSLAPAARPLEVRASRKQTSSFEWGTADRLISVKTVNGTPGEAGSAVYFDYFPGGGVRRVNTEPFSQQEEVPLLAPDSAKVTPRGAWTLLPNHPQIDVAMVQRFTGKKVATVVAGNPYFHPFVWTGLFTFLAEYDADGRIRSASQINLPTTAPARILTFEWQDMRLTTVVERNSKGEPTGYRRDISYSDGQISAETVHFQGKTNKIEYKREKGRLVEAICEADPSLDSRSRRVTFRE